jgi:hypothetical protein
MTDAVSVSSAAGTDRQGLAARAFGVVFSPRATYEDVAASPRWLGVLLLVVIVSVVGLAVFLSSERGQMLAVDQEVTALESFGITVSDEMYARMEARAPRAAYVAGAGQAVFIPLLSVVVAGLAMGIFNVLLGDDGTFRQVFAVVAHSNVIGVLGLLFMLPLNYARDAVSNPATLAVFAPMLEDTGFAARFLGAIDLFRIWWIVNVSIGLGVLYKRRIGPIAMSFLVLYAVIAVAIAAVMVSVAGA